MIWSTSCHHAALLVHWTQSLLFIVVSGAPMLIPALTSSPHGPSHPCLWLAHHNSNPVLHSQSISIDLLHLATWHHVMFHTQWAPSTTLVEHCNKSKATSPPWLKLLTLVYLWTKYYLCISHKYILVHLGCHSITKTKLGRFNVVCKSMFRIVDPCYDISLGYL